MYQEYHDGLKEMSATLDTVIDMLKEKRNVASQRAASFNSMSGNQFRGQRYQDNRTFYGTNLRLNQYGDYANYGWYDAYTQVPEAPVQQYDRLEMKLQQALDNQRRIHDEINKPRAWEVSETEVSEAPVQYDRIGMKLQQALDNQRRMLELLNSEKRPWEVSETAVGITEETNQEEELTEVQSRVEEKADLDYFGLVSVDTVVSVDRQTPTSDERDEISAKSEIWESSEEVSVDRSECVDRHEGFSGQSTSLFVHLSTDTVVSVDRHEPMLPENNILESIDEAEPPIHDTDLPDPAHELKPPEPDPTPPEHHETKLVEVLPEEAATPGSCQKRKLPDTTLQQPLKRMRSHTGAAIIPAAAYLPDPGDTYDVYSNGPRPPPPEQWYVLFELPSSLAGRCSYPPRSHPDIAYLPDPEKTYAVYHLGPRPP